MSTSTTQLIATVNSDGTVSPGQDNRSSENFTFTIPQGTIDLQWNVINTPNAGTVTFNVMQDISLGHDPTVAKGLKNGGYTNINPLYANTDYYIANPSNNPGNPAPPFTVQVFAVFPG